MPWTAPYTPEHLKSIHLLRALLREASYLPDSPARSYFRRYIVGRFKAYQPRQNATENTDTRAVALYQRGLFKRRHASIIDERTQAMQRRARKGLNYLRRANLGEAPCLEKVLLVTYGRMGRRRYALLDHLMKPDPPVGAPGPSLDLPGPSPLQKHYYSNKRYLRFFQAPKKISEKEVNIEFLPQYARLLAVLKSQTQRGISIGREIRNFDIKRPANNIWERPMPIKRARNDVRKWYAQTIGRLLPPLPSEEWDRLRALAVGDEIWRGAVARRAPAKPLHPQTEDDFARAKDRLEEGIRLDKPSKADRPFGNHRPHNINAKLMERMYAKVLGLSCKLERNDAKDQWRVVWGTLRDRIPQIYSNPVDDVLFAGVDRKGQLRMDAKPRNPILRED
jgi:hypothetical protein